MWALPESKPDRLCGWRRVWSKPCFTWCEAPSIRTTWTTKVSKTSFVSCAICRTAAKKSSTPTTTNSRLPPMYRQGPLLNTRVRSSLPHSYNSFSSFVCSSSCWMLFQDSPLLPSSFFCFVFGFFGFFCHFFLCDILRDSFRILIYFQKHIDLNFFLVLKILHSSRKMFSKLLYQEFLEVLGILLRLLIFI